MKRPKFTVNFYKVVVGVAFSLLWARIMYFLWTEPSYVTFIWFYLVVGSIVLKWVFFEIIDRIHLKVRRSAVERELRESSMRVREAAENGDQNNA